MWTLRSPRLGPTGRLASWRLQPSYESVKRNVCTSLQAPCPAPRRDATRTETNRKQVLPTPAVLWLTEATVYTRDFLDCACASNRGGRLNTQPAAAASLTTTPHKLGQASVTIGRGVSTMLDSACNLSEPEPHSSPAPSSPSQFDSKLVRCSSAHRRRDRKGGSATCHRKQPSLDGCHIWKEPRPCNPLPPPSLPTRALSACVVALRRPQHRRSPPPVQQGDVVQSKEATYAPSTYGRLTALGPVWSHACTLTTTET